MRLSRELPVYSPLDLGALGAGLRAMAAGGATARGQVEELVRRDYAPGDLLATDSGTSALALALIGATAESRKPSPVALPAYCCFDLATAADGAGVPVLLYDLDPHTLGPDWASLERILARGAGAVVVAHLFGVPVDLDRVSEACRKSGSVLIEDAAQGAGARWHDRRLGTVGSLALLSFGRGKGVTGGGGGVLLANDAAGLGCLARVEKRIGPPARGVASWLSSVAQWALARRAVYGLPASLPFLGLGETRYRPSTPPRGMAASCAGALVRTWALAERENLARRERAARLRARLDRSTELRVPAAPPGGEGGFLRLPVVLGAGAGAEAAAMVELGVMPGYPRALCDLAGFAERTGRTDESFTGARHLARSLYTLPTHSRLSPRSAARIEAWIDRWTQARTPAAV
jgi:dTDP-4-amino-4,6-dideoxygalactose transaminase